MQMMELIAAQAAASAAELPFLLLQAAAVVGMVSVLILLRRNIALEDPRYKIYYGLVFGMTGFLLTLLVSEFIKLPSKPYIRSDLLFLAGVLGSWQGGLISLSLVAAGRFVFGDPVLFFAALQDMVIISACGIIMYGWMRDRRLADLGTRDILTVFAVRFMAALLAITISFVFGLIDQTLFLSAIGRRTLGAVAVGLPMIVCLFILLRSEARARRGKETRVGGADGFIDRTAQQARPQGPYGNGHAAGAGRFARPRSDRDRQYCRCRRLRGGGLERYFLAQAGAGNLRWGIRPAVQRPCTLQLHVR